MSESHKNPSCFSAILKRLICASDLPTHPDDSHDHNQIKNTVSSNVIINDKNTQLVAEEQNAGQVKPGIVARLMGLESMPENNTALNEAMFYRSKSLNSLHFFPDFNTKKGSHSAFHRRSATVNSSSGFSRFAFKIEEEKSGLSKLNCLENRGGVKQSVKKKQGKREKVVEENLSGNERRKIKEKKKYEEGFATSTSRKVKKNNVGCGRGGGLIRDKKCAVLMQKQGRLVGGGGLRVNDVGLNASIKERVHQSDVVKEDDLSSHVDHEALSDSLSRSPVLSDALSRSPVSVLDHHFLHLHLDYSPSKEYEKSTPANTRNKPKPKIHKEAPQENIKPKAPPKKDYYDDEVSSRIQRPKLDNNHKSKKASDDQEGELEEYFVGLLGQICRLTEEEVKDSNWVANSQEFGDHFVEELSLDFGGQILDLLLDQLLDELVSVS